ncbi:molybdopterin-synthase adenylyltransferase MoeB [Nesterenkonia sp. HG001]|uniref:molybdopterin-synthase adenylyltransferase MoeB n=1 Tax=Nesterenkonia sp. HG001 TaxID=2983207 RepID=UPI002AC5A0F0|nr:molybdopterin-synthase adenylyltransferase MoeB [Nesterenkonia sp. HG001]MDZ5078306.1 molybdopterin-synthase adenylyltransferase MoeB [Nesterenkonia sp. HG001]
MTELKDLSQTQLERFQRHFSLTGFGPDAQLRLLDARVLVIGAGGLGAPILTYLAAAGVGTIDVVDHDVVDRSNLHRQVLHSEAGIGRPKTESAAAVMRGLHPEITVHEHREPITGENALALVEPVDIVVDGSDNFATRYVVSDACEIAGKPLVYGSILRFAGQVSLFWSRLPSGERGPTYRDLYPEAPDAGEVPTCAEAGVLGVLPGVIGTLMATETIKFLAGVGDTLLGRVMTYDALTASFREVRLLPDPDREPVTSIGADVAGLGGGPGGGAASAGAACAVEEDPALHPVEGETDPYTGHPFGPEDIGIRELQAAVEAGRIAGVVDVREPWEYAAGHVEGAVNVPLGELWHGSEVPGIDEASEQRPVVLYCKIGVRSRQALAVLRHRNPDAGLRNLVGGYEQVKAAGG